MARQLREALDRKREQGQINIIRRLEVERRIGLSRSAIYRRISEGKFPQPVPLGGGDDAHAVGWIESEIDAYLVACIAARAAKRTPCEADPAPEVVPTPKPVGKRGKTTRPATTTSDIVDPQLGAGKDAG